MTAGKVFVNEHQVGRFTVEPGKGNKIVITLDDGFFLSADHLVRATELFDRSFELRPISYSRLEHA